MNETTNTIRVAVAVTVNDETKTFAAEASTAGNAWRIARRIAEGVRAEADDWLSRAQFEAEKFGANR